VYAKTPIQINDKIQRNIADRGERTLIKKKSTVTLMHKVRVNSSLEHSEIVNYTLNWQGIQTNLGFEEESKDSNTPIDSRVLPSSPSLSGLLFNRGEEGLI
jgi:hypothetical protein